MNKPLFIFLVMRHGHRDRSGKKLEHCTLLLNSTYSLQHNLIRLNAYLCTCTNILNSEHVIFWSVIL